MESFNLEISEKTSKNLTLHLITPTYSNLVYVLSNCDEKELFIISNYLLKIYYDNIELRINLKFIIVILFLTSHYIECLHYLDLYFGKYKKDEIELIRILLMIKIKTSYIDPENDEDINSLESLGVQKEFILMLKVASYIRINNFEKSLELSYELFHELKNLQLAYIVVVDSAIKNSDTLLLTETFCLAKKNNITFSLDRNSIISAKKLLQNKIIDIIKKIK